MIIDAPTRDQIPALRRLWQEAFGDSDGFLNLFFGSAYAPDRCRCVTEQGEVTAALYWLDCDCHGQRIAYLYAVATAQARRGRGLCRLLMENTHAHLAALGYTGALLVPGTEDLFRLYQKLGYGSCCEIQTLHGTASQEAIPLRSVEIQEYAILRRALLPDGGVIQEGENLRFLQGQAKLYAGEGFLLAARHGQNRLFGLELLGDTSHIPAILSTLGAAEGTFRTPGNGQPFGMYLPLGEHPSLPPTYFGLAFD